MTASLPAQRLRAGVSSQVESYDEETYRLKPGDTYRSLSYTFYNSDKYERALTLFNRDHVQASDGARLEPPVLAAGQPVFIPPPRILEKYYGVDAPEPTPVASLSANLQAPRPPAPAPAAPARTGTVAEDGRTYQVPAGGEMFLQIARRALGSGDRWVEIYKLNPQYNPQDAVPGGTVLRLPRQ
jgi:nucleoid-associated protein YgaU